MQCAALEIKTPTAAYRLDQDEEWIEIVTSNGREKLRLHDYARFYSIPGLYDEFYQKLDYRSPRVVCQTLRKKMAEQGDPDKPIRVLDFGAGNGQVGESLNKELDCQALVGLDIIPEARAAAHRDRPGIYDEYYILDMASPSEEDLEKLSGWDFDALVTVAALGFGDISADAFANAFNLMKDGSWIAFNIKDSFLCADDKTGFCRAINSLLHGSLEMIETSRYRHRMSLGGAPLYYYVIIGKKLKDV